MYLFLKVIWHFTFQYWRQSLNSLRCQFYFQWLKTWLMNWVSVSLSDHLFPFCARELFKVMIERLTWTMKENLKTFKSMLVHVVVLLNDVSLLLFSGSVPPYYREVYDIVCPEQDRIDRDLFVKILIKSSLPKQALSTVSSFVIYMI